MKKKLSIIAAKMVSSESIRTKPTFDQFYQETKKKESCIQQVKQTNYMGETLNNLTRNKKEKKLALHKLA